MCWAPMLPKVGFCFLRQRPRTLDVDARAAFTGTDYHEHSAAAHALLPSLQVGVLEGFAGDEAVAQVATAVAAARVCAC